MANLKIPESSSTVRVRMFDTTTNMVVNAGMFLEPVVPGHENLNLSTVGFLIEHESLGKKVVFDLGAKKDFWNLVPFTRDRIPNVCSGLKVDQNASEILQNADIDLNSITSVIWSHMHWDHCGDVNTFPVTTELVVGPDFMNNFLPGYPSDPDGKLLEQWFEDRPLREISFLSGHQVGDFPAFDFFGDGSFYLLDAPGHCVGHVCGFARTTPDTFIFMGGDICHFPGYFRPSPSLPLPGPLSEHASSKTSPFYIVTRNEQSVYADRERSIDSIKKMEALDGSLNVLVCIAHDPSLLHNLPVLNKTPSEDLNEWKARGFKEKCLWGFLDELPKNGQPGRKPLVEGIWKEGRVVNSLS